MDCELCASFHEPRVVCENEHAFVIVCIEPLNDGHVMVIPKRHVDTVGELAADEAKSLMDLTAQMEKTLRTQFPHPPIIFLNSDSHKSQSHLHVHVLPSKGALRDLVAGFEQIPSRVRRPMEELTQLAEAIQSAM